MNKILDRLGFTYLVSYPELSCVFLSISTIELLAKAVHDFYLNIIWCSHIILKLCLCGDLITFHPNSPWHFNGGSIIRISVSFIGIDHFTMSKDGVSKFQSPFHFCFLTHGHIAELVKANLSL